MPSKCCVPNCRGNYKNGPKVTTFSFPKDEEVKGKWLRAISRVDFIPTINTKVCEAHFEAEDIERTTSCYVESTGELLTAKLGHPRLRKDAVPKIFSWSSQCLTQVPHREEPDEKKNRLENSMLRRALQESVQTHEKYVETRSFKSLQELDTKLDNVGLGKWVKTKRDNKLYLLYFNEDNNSVPCTISISDNLSVNFFCGDLKVSLPSENKTKNLVTVDNLNDLENILQDAVNYTENARGKSVKESLNLILLILSSLMVKLPDYKMVLQFMSDQIRLLSHLNNHAFRYSCEMTLFCGLLYTISPHAYKYIRSYGNLLLPSPSTIKRICRKFPTDPRTEQKDSSFLHYVLTKFSFLKSEDKTVILMVDEIHLKPYMDYRGGNIVGNAFNSAESATTAHVFMIGSILSPYKEVVHILPVKTLKADSLHHFIKKVILGLENIGFEVIAVVSDNNAINKKAMSLFSEPSEIKNVYHHPKNSERPLFFIIDPVHILKNLRNNWLNKIHQRMIYPHFKENNSENEFKIASFGALKQMHLSEKSELLKYGYSLTLKALYPSSIERQNVNLVLQIFNRTIATALRELGPKKQFDFYNETASYIEIVSTWWDIINVKTPLKGQRLKNPFMEPVTKNSNHILSFLNDFVNWVSKWKQSSSEGKLSKETESALFHTTEGLIKMSEYCLNEKKFNYILLGKIQTDQLEERFGKYRQQAGSQYHISIRQVFESESKLRMQTLIPLVLKSKVYGNINITLDDVLQIFDPEVNEAVQHTHVNRSLVNACIIDEDDINQIEPNIWPILTYIAGYASYSAIKKFKCEYCKAFLTEDKNSTITTNSNLITANSRGGLCYPHQDVVTCCAYTYILVLKLIENEQDFLREANQREIAVSLSFSALTDLDIDLFLGYNCLKHSLRNVIMKILNSTSNILLNNYIKKQNDITKTKTMPQLKRIKFTN